MISVFFSFGEGVLSLIFFRRLGRNLNIHLRSQARKDIIGEFEKPTQGIYMICELISLHLNAFSKWVTDFRKYMTSLGGLESKPSDLRREGPELKFQTKQQRILWRGNMQVKFIKDGFHLMEK